MTVETTTTIAGPYPTNGVATAFPFSFRALSADEVQVVREVSGVEATVSPSLYKVQLSAQSGAVVFDAPPAAGANIYVLSDPDFKQNISFSNQSAFLPSSHNEANDRSAIRAQVLAEQVKRAPVLPLDPSKAAGLFPKVRADGSWGYEAAGPGATGPANSTYTTRRKLELAPVTNRSYNFAPDADDTSGWPAGMYFFTPGDFSGAQYAADFVSGLKVKLDAAPLATGALLRQGADSVTTQQDGGGSVPRTAQSKSNDFVNALDKGVVADGVTDDRAAMQRAIDTASSLGRPLQLPSGIIAAGAPGLDLRGRYVDMRGAPGRTTIKALSPMATLINAEEPADTYNSPFNIQDVIFDGDNKVTNANLSVRFRHGYDLSNIFSYNTTRAFRERDCYLSRHWNLRTATCQTAFHIEGSNHSSIYVACSAIGATAEGILLEGKGAVDDGNHALLFVNCDVEFGEGVGIRAGVGTSADFEGCYIGEAIDKDVIENLGGVLKFRGGIHFFGHKTTSYLVHPVGGRTDFEGRARIAGQDFGSLLLLTRNTPAEINAGAGKVRFGDIDAFVPVGGTPMLQGNPLDTGPQRDVFAPRYGRLYAQLLNNATANVSPGAGPSMTGGGADASALRITCTAAPGPTPIIGLYSPLIHTRWRTGEAGYFVLVYRASKEVSIRVTQSPLGTPDMSLGTAPASPDIATYLRLDASLPGISSGNLEFISVGVAAGDYIEIIEAYFADSTMHKQGLGTIGALCKC